MSIETKVLKYIGAGYENQEPEKSNKTLINRFENEMECPIIFCSKVGKTLKYVSTLNLSSKGYKRRNIDGVKRYVFNFDMINIHIGNFIELQNMKKGEKPTWLKKEISKEKEKRKKSKRMISDKKLRELINEMQFIGDIGELVAIEYETNRLKSIGLKEYIKEIEHTSYVKGHGYGYDIKSFDKDINDNVYEIFIEVKATKLSEESNFIMTENEYRTFLDYKEKYRIYRVYDIYETGVSVRPITDLMKEVVITSIEKTSYSCRVKVS